MDKLTFSELYLTSSTDWTCKLWHNDKAIATFESSTDCVYDIKWCPSQPTIFANVDGTGNMNLWNLGEDFENPQIKCPVTDRALSTLEWSRNGQKLIVGNTSGSLFVYDTKQVVNKQSEIELLQKMIQ